jgi:hypothetical protein
MARVTNGIFTPVLQPRDLQSIFEQVNFSDIAELKIRNRTKKSEADYVLRNADGSFSALLEMDQGKNDIEVYARSTDGSEQTRKITLNFLTDGQVQQLDPRLLAQRNRLMQNRLADLRDRRIAVQAERDEEIRRDLQVRIQEERVKAEERARELRIEESKEAGESKDAPGNRQAGEPSDEDGEARSR